MPDVMVKGNASRSGWDGTVGLSRRHNRKPARRGVEERNKLAADNARLVWGVALSMKRRGQVQHLPLEDAVGAGWFGLLRAAELWDPTIARFSTYATQWINQFIWREATGRAQRDLGMSLDRPSGETGCTIAMSLEDYRPGETHPDKIDADSVLARLMAPLAAQDRQAITLHIVRGMSLKETGEIMGGVSRERARQCVERGLARMRTEARLRGIRWDGRAPLKEPA
ncbi:MAG TPA: sigma-70 family RNA polymerase sigma factor [Aquabacterium sp.]|nr:sigma-70 family RNA polymerase sigma factor [Aquabacterium sp.]